MDKLKTVLTPKADDHGYLDFDLDEELGEKVVEALARNNTFFPAIRHVSYRTDPEGDTLTTIVQFADGTRSVVRNCGGDKIELDLENVKLSDGSTTAVLTADHESREMGLMCAIVKRLVCTFAPDGITEGNGFASFVEKTVRNATRQDVVEAVNKAELGIRRRKATVEGAREKPAEKKQSLRDVVKGLSEVVEELKKTIKEGK